MNEWMNEHDYSEWHCHGKLLQGTVQELGALSVSWQETTRQTVLSSVPGKIRAVTSDDVDRTLADRRGVPTSRHVRRTLGTKSVRFSGEMECLCEVPCRQRCVRSHSGIVSSPGLSTSAVRLEGRVQIHPRPDESRVIFVVWPHTLKECPLVLVRL